MESSTRWMIYGAYGFNGEAIAREAVVHGMEPILAGRDRSKVRLLADELGCEARVFDLSDPHRIVENLDGISAVLNCAGPFSSTAVSVMDACVKAGSHYLDITGEISVIEAAAQRGPRAAEASIVLMPAVGFDVVPSDCLAAKLLKALPDATHLQLAFAGTGTISRGTARTMFENIPRGGRARVDGKIIRVPLVWKTKDVPFPDGTRPAVTIPWGDVATAWYSTGIPNIEVYTAMSRGGIRLLRLFEPFLFLMKIPLPSMLKRLLLRSFMFDSKKNEPPGGKGSLWGCAWNDDGGSVEATLSTVGPYRLTVLTALGALDRLLTDTPRPGFLTPSMAFGDDFILTIPGTEFDWSR